MNSKYFLLRDRLLYGRPALYYTAIILNLIFKCSWTLTISPAVLLLIPPEHLSSISDWVVVNSEKVPLELLHPLEGAHGQITTGGLSQYDPEVLLI